MARSPDTEEFPSGGQRLDFAHPRTASELIGHSEQVGNIAHQIGTGVLPHGILAVGPEGVGKATFAYRLARILLAQPEEAPDPTDLSLKSGQTDALIRQNAHPDLLAVERPYDQKTKKIRATITVDEVRRMNSFFETTPSFSKWRVAIVDRADDLNRNAANALLKTLEEPPKNCLLILISSSPGRLLPTIRSRVRRLNFSPLSDVDVRAGLQLHVGGVSSSHLDDIVKGAEGSIGVALELAHDDGEILADLGSILANIETDPAQRYSKMVDSLARLRTGPIFDRALEMIRAETVRRARAAAQDPQNSRESVRAWARYWTQLNDWIWQSESLNLDRKQMFFLAFGGLKTLAIAK